MMRFSMLTILFWLTSLSFAHLSYANTIDLLCEGEIETLQELTSMPDKWHVSANNKAKFVLANSKTQHALSAIGFSEELNGTMTLVPPERTTISKSNKQAFVSTWQFKPEQSIHYVCSYWDTAIQLSKTLPKKANTCYVEGKRDGSAIKAWCEIAQQQVEVIEMAPEISTNAVTAPTNEAPAEDVALTPIVTPDEEDILPKALPLNASSQEVLPSDRREALEESPLAEKSQLDEALTNHDVNTNAAAIDKPIVDTQVTDMSDSGTSDSDPSVNENSESEFIMDAVSEDSHLEKDKPDTDVTTLQNQADLAK